jgi:hypothetical protein
VLAVHAGAGAVVVLAERPLSDGEGRSLDGRRVERLLQSTAAGSTRRVASTASAVAGVVTGDAAPGAGTTVTCSRAYTES